MIILFEASDSVESTFSKSQGEKFLLICKEFLTSYKHQGWPTSWYCLGESITP